MIKKLLFASIIICLFLIVGCNAPIKHSDDFNLIFTYGIGANTLDTFNNTYTRDMITDANITIDLYLSQEEMDAIYEKMIEIDFFNYPDVFSRYVPEGSIVGERTPYFSYYFKVAYDSYVKELTWNDNIRSVLIRGEYITDDKVDKLKSLTQLITHIIESKEEYKKLPEPRGGYQ